MVSILINIFVINVSDVSKLPFWEKIFFVKDLFLLLYRDIFFQSAL